MYEYSVHKIKGSLTDNTPIKELEKELNMQGEDGFRLCAAIPQVYEGSTDATILIFESEDEQEY